LSSGDALGHGLRVMSKKFVAVVLVLLMVLAVGSTIISLLMA
jgi:hypothetical protein